MEKRVVVITGGASGIGWAAAEGFLHRGWSVVIADRELKRVHERLPNLPADIEAVMIDVTSQESVDRVFSQVSERRGRLDALVNSAGIQQWTSLAQLDWQAWHAVQDVNLNGTLRCLQAAGTRMIPQGHGAIVNLSSVAGVRGVPNRTGGCRSDLLPVFGGILVHHRTGDRRGRRLSCRLRSARSGTEELTL